MSKKSESSHSKLTLKHTNKSANGKTEKSKTFGINLSLMELEVLDRLCESVVALNLAGEIIYWSEGAGKISGYSNDEVMGKSILDVFKPVGTDVFEDYLQKIADGTDVAGEWEGKRKNGLSVWIEYHTTVMRNGKGNITGVWCSGKDITKRKMMEAELRASEERFRSLYENATIGLYRTTPEGEILITNPALLNMLGYSCLKDLAERDLEKDGFEPGYPRRFFKELMAEKGEVRGLESAWRKKDGSIIYIRESARAIKNSEGQILYYEGTVEDITERKKAEEALINERELLVRILSSLNEAVLLVDPFTYEIYDCNSTTEKIFGYVKNEIIGNTTAIFYVDLEMLPKYAKEWLQALSEQGYYFTEFNLKRKNGEIFPSEHYIAPLYDHQRKLFRIIVVVRDISERKQVEDTLRESEGKFRSIIQHSNDGISLVNEKGMVIEWNRGQERLTGLSRAEVLGKPAWEIQHRISLPSVRTQRNLLRIKKAIRHFLKTGKGLWMNKIIEINIQLDDGGNRAVQQMLFPIATDKGYMIGCIARDITQQKSAEEEIKRERDRAQKYLDVADVIMIAIDARQKVVMINKKGCEILGYPEAEILHKNWFDCFLPAEIKERVREDFLRLSSGNYVSVSYFENPVLTKSGPERLIAWHNVVITDEKGNFSHTLSSGEDITERRHAEEALVESERKYRKLVHNAVYGIFRSTVDGKLLDLNPALVKMLGYDSEDELLQLDIENDIHINPVDRQSLLNRYKESKKAGSDEVLWKRKDGKSITVRLSGHPILNDKDELEGLEMIVEDVTEQRNFEKNLLQIQKLESLGILAGGIAHDFNNLLQGILGNASLVLMDLPSQSPFIELLRDIEDSARRAADLTGKMLAYSGKGRFIVKPLDLSEIVEGMNRLLKSTVSKNSILRYNLERNLPLIEGDEAQVRQVLMNLVLNSSESLENRSGVINIKTGKMFCPREYLRETYLDENQNEGWYSYIEVSDTGCGMDKETMVKIFDPFFSTKFIGRGLGLAAVLGIVRGHKGAIKISSEVELGTIFRILFPSLEITEFKKETTAAPKISYRGSGLVLLVDDEEKVITVGQRILERLGFQVITADSGSKALEIFKHSPDEIKLVILDLTMPEMDGIDTFREIRKIKSDTRVIISSGYNELEATSQLAGKGLRGFLKKPYIFSEVEDKVRQVLEGE